MAQTSSPSGLTDVSVFGQKVVHTPHSPLAGRHHPGCVLGALGWARSTRMPCSVTQGGDTDHRESGPPNSGRPGRVPLWRAAAGGPWAAVPSTRPVTALLRGLSIPEPAGHLAGSLGPSWALHPTSAPSDCNSAPQWPKHQPPAPNAVCSFTREAAGLGPFCELLGATAPGDVTHVCTCELVASTASE